MAAKALYDAAMQHPRFAGPFAYDSQKSSKVFMGEEAAAPVGAVIAALAAAEHGSASVSQQKVIKQQIQPQPSPTDSKATTCALKCGGPCPPENGAQCVAKQAACRNSCMSV